MLLVTLLCLQCCCKPDQSPCSLCAMPSYWTSALLSMPSAAFQMRQMPTGKPLSHFATAVCNAEKLRAEVRSFSAGFSSECSNTVAFGAAPRRIQDMFGMTYSGIRYRTQIDIIADLRGTGAPSLGHEFCQ